MFLIGRIGDQQKSRHTWFEDNRLSVIKTGHHSLAAAFEVGNHAADNPPSQGLHVRTDFDWATVAVNHIDGRYLTSDQVEKTSTHRFNFGQFGHW